MSKLSASIIHVLVLLSMVVSLLACVPTPVQIVVVVTATPPASAPQVQATPAPTVAPPVAGQPTITPVAKSTSAPTSVPTVKAPTAPSTLTPLPINVPAPKSGTGNVAGRILWNSKGAGGLEVKLCEDIQLFGGCKGKEFKTKTDQDGVYMLTEVIPGEYALAVQSIDKKDAWLYVTSGLLTVRKYTVAADKTFTVGDQSIYKSDLKSISPADESKTDNSKPSLSWEKYPDAAYYQVTFRPENGKSIFSGKKVETSQIASENPLITCKYTWKVEAYNASGIKISEFDSYQDFSVTSQPTSCYVTIIAPLSNAQVSGSGIKLLWEAHPLATYYTLVMYDQAKGSNEGKIIDYLQVKETSYTLTDNLKPGKYVWYVYVYDQFKEQVASSSILYLIVK